MAANRGKASIALCCVTLGVRREGYYAWRKRPSHEQGDALLVSALKEIRKKHPAYGVRSMLEELIGVKKPSYGKGYRICRDNGLLDRRRKTRGITKSNPEAQAADDLLKRDFVAVEPNAKWLTDITQMQCKDGKLYLCCVLDCYDAAIVGVSMDTNMRAGLCVSALNSAVYRYGINDGLILHSDRGSQYTSHLFRETLSFRMVRQSMGRSGSCFDNARMESFYATLKKELIYRLPIYNMAREEVRAKVFEWIIGYYNLRRRHTANEWNLPPLVKRKRYGEQLAVA